MTIGKTAIGKIIRKTTNEADEEKEDKKKIDVGDGGSRQVELIAAREQNQPADRSIAKASPTHEMGPA